MAGLFRGELDYHSRLQASEEFLAKFAKELLSSDR